MSLNLHRDVLQIRTLMIENTPMRLSSYRVGDRWVSRVDDIDPGTVLGRGRGATRLEAECKAIEGATLKVELTMARATLRRGIEILERVHE